MPPHQTSSTSPSNSASPASSSFSHPPPSLLRSFSPSTASFSTTLLPLAALLRIVLIAYGAYHDAHHALKYTDVDYFVFSDAAAFIMQPSTPAPGRFSKAAGRIGTPYDRATYRYTPLLAALLVPNTLLHPIFGKCLFAAADLVVGCLLYHILTQQQRLAPSKAKLYVSTIWLLNPFVANISTRGSAEALLGVIVVAALALANAQRWKASAVVFGLAVHFKLYPVIYAAPFMAKLADEGMWWRPQWRQLQFAVVSFASFMLLNLGMYSIWGQPFIEHTFLYHLTRLDHRHNLSHHFYAIYLQLSSSPASLATEASSLDLRTLASTLLNSTFVPQLGLVATLGIFLGRRASLSFAMFVQTLTFTTFNRVCTSQYFMWSLWFLPLVLHELHFQSRWEAGGWTLLLAWVAGQAVWLRQAYGMELLGEARFVSVWEASALLFAIQAWLVVHLLGAYRRPAPSPSQRLKTA